jgi:hypothetical protein
MPLLRIALLVGVVLIIGVAVFAVLGSGDPPISRIEQVVPDDRFAR